MSTRWLAESFEQGTLVGRVGRDGSRLVADWPGRARFSVEADGEDALFEASANADRVEVEKIRNGPARLLLAHLRGAIPLHGSAVALHGRAVVFVGGSGLGKSTLAAVLCDQFGASLLGDDAVSIERDRAVHQVVALEEKHWLDVGAARAIGRSIDSGNEKLPLTARRADVSRATLVMIVQLAFSERSVAPALQSVLGLEAVSGLLAQFTRFVVDDPTIARRDLAALADLVDRVRIVRLERPRRLELLRASAELVARACQKEMP